MDFKSLHDLALAISLAQLVLLSPYLRTLCPQWPLKSSLFFSTLRISHAVASAKMLSIPQPPSTASLIFIYPLHPS